MNIFKKFFQRIEKRIAQSHEREMKNKSTVALQEFNKKINEHNILSEMEKAALFAQCIHLQCLKSPSTAKFSALNEMQVNKIDENYVVSGYVDAHNSYGGVMRDEFSYTVTNTSEKWVCLKNNDYNTSVITWTIILLIGIPLVCIFILML